MNQYELVLPEIEHKEEVMTMLEEIKIADTGKRWQYAGMSSLEEYSNYEEWLGKIKKESQGIDLAPDRVAATTYIMVKKDSKRVVGIVNIRHELNDFLLNYCGHIGYSIRPSDRKKGLGTLQLQLSLEKAESLGINKVLITCDTENIGSAKTIEKCQGKLENIIPKKDGYFTKRYWISNN